MSEQHTPGCRMRAKEMLKQAVRQVCEEAGEPWEELDEDDFDDTHIVKTAEVFAKLVLAEHAAELDALRTENARLLAELEAVGAGGVQPLRAESGWALVPLEPTDEMLEAAVQAICYGPGGGFTRISGPHRCWSAMLTAAPKAPQQPVPPQKPELRVGQVWQTRGGQRVIIKAEMTTYPFRCVSGDYEWVVTKDGRFSTTAGTTNDLIELISDVQKGGEA